MPVQIFNFLLNKKNKFRNSLKLFYFSGYNLPFND